MSVIATNTSNISNISGPSSYTLISSSFKTFLRFDRWIRYANIKLHCNHYYNNNSKSVHYKVLDLLCGNTNLTLNHIGNYTTMDILIEIINEINKINNNNNSTVDYNGIDINHDNYKSSKLYYQYLIDTNNKLQSIFNGEFVSLDLFEKYIDNSYNNNYNLVVCMSRLQKIWTSEKLVTQFLSNACSALKLNECFIGVTIDSAAIWNKAIKSKQFNQSISANSIINPMLNTKANISVLGELYKLTFTQQFDTINPEFNKFGCKFNLELFDKTNHSGYLIHFPTLISIAKSLGLECLYITNYNEFYIEHQQSMRDNLIKMKVIEENNSINNSNLFKLPANVIDLIGLYCVFAFKKVAQVTMQ